MGIYIPIPVPRFGPAGALAVAGTRRTLKKTLRAGPAWRYMSLNDVQPQHGTMTFGTMLAHTRR